MRGFGIEDELKMKKWKYTIGTVLVTVCMAACATASGKLQQPESGYESAKSASVLGKAGVDEQTESQEETIHSSADVLESENIRETETVEETVTEEETTQEETLSKEEQERLAYEARKSVLNQYQRLGVVKNVTNNLNIRESAKEDGLIIGKAVEYAGLEIIDETGDWYKVRVGDSYGYVTKEYVATGEEAEELAVEHAEQKAVVTAQILNVRKGPSLLTNVMLRVSVKDRYPIVKQYDNWTQIQVLENVTGYVSNDFISVDYFLPSAYIIKEYQGLSETRRNLVSMAFEYLGGKYVWGGTTLGVGVDCSGYVMRLYEAQGIIIHRVSIEQATDGRQVSPEEMKPGDLIFYETLGPYISHVAMYIGDGKIIHAASEKKGICINEWNYIEPVMIRNIIGD